MSIDWFQGDNFGPTFHLAQAKTIGPVETNPVRCSPNYIWFIWILNYDLYETQTIIETTTQTMLSSTRTGRRALQTETLSTRTRTGCTGCTTEEKVVLSMIPSRNRSASPALEEVPSWPLWLWLWFSVWQKLHPRHRGCRLVVLPGRSAHEHHLLKRIMDDDRNKDHNGSKQDRACSLCHK